MQYCANQSAEDLQNNKDVGEIQPPHARKVVVFAHLAMSTQRQDEGNRPTATEQCEEEIQTCVSGETLTVMFVGLRGTRHRRERLLRRTLRRWRRLWYSHLMIADGTRGDLACPVLFHRERVFAMRTFDDEFHGFFADNYLAIKLWILPQLSEKLLSI